MIDGKSVLAVVVARGGSKGIPRKNLLPVAGKPLVAWSVVHARESALIDRLILSTDDAEIRDVATAYGIEAPFLRPAALATDRALVQDVLIHAIDNLDRHYDYIVLLQATSPLRRGSDIDGCIKQCRRSGAPACVSVTEPAKSPYWMFSTGPGGRMMPLFPEGWTVHRRQDLPRAWALNGAVYVAETEWFRQTRDFVRDGTVAFEMPRSRSIDIDEPADLLTLEAILTREPAAVAMAGRAP